MNQLTKRAYRVTRTTVSLVLVDATLPEDQAEEIALSASPSNENVEELYAEDEYAERDEDNDVYEDDDEDDGYFED